jgi:hypothetical protein
MRIIKCPKCGNRPIRYVEFWKDHTISFETDGITLEDPNCDPGDPYKVHAHCLCGHEWRLKKITQITEILPTDKEKS